MHMCTKVHTECIFPVDLRPPELFTGVRACFPNNVVAVAGNIDSAGLAQVAYDAFLLHSGGIYVYSAASRNDNRHCGCHAALKDFLHFLYLHV